MKKEKVVLFVLCILSMLLLALSIGSFVQINKLQNQIDEQKPTQIQRYFYSILDEVLLDGNVQFIELDTTKTDTIESWNNVIYVVELTEMTMVELTITFENKFLEWYDNSVDLNIYYGGITDADISYEDLSKTVSYTFVLQKGFNTIELDSYSDSSWEYTITIKRKN